MSFAWTDENTATAKRMWLAGESGDRIAIEIGAPSRNAVIGKLCRLGVQRPALVGALNKVRAQKIAAERKPKADIRPAVANTKRRQESERTSTEAEIICAPKTLVALCAHECKWPIGDVLEGSGHEQLFCARGTVRGETYCLKHSKLSVSKCFVVGTVSDLIRRYAA